jgi:hypothetical protein
MAVNVTQWQLLVFFGAVGSIYKSEVYVGLGIYTWRRRF